MYPQTSRHNRRCPRSARAFLALCSLALAAGCSGELETPVSGSLAMNEASGLAPNGLTPNGLITNGLITNGLITNGLAENGLSSGGFASEGFRNWFDSNPPSLSDVIMNYVVSCAVAAGQTRAWTHPATGTTYVWSGGLGLAPQWADGLSVTMEEQQVITACLAARTNKYGRTVLLSILGEDSRGNPIPVSDTERAQFSEPEGAFFGNLFVQEGIFSCSDRSLNVTESTERACSLSSKGAGTGDCPPIAHVGDCNKDAHCQLDSTKTYYQKCEHGAQQYRALTTRLSPSSIYRCGDGICQFTEKCGQHNSWNDCNADCGSC